MRRVVRVTLELDEDHDEGWDGASDAAVFSRWICSESTLKELDFTPTVVEGKEVWILSGAKLWIEPRLADRWPQDDTWPEVIF